MGINWRQGAIFASGLLLGVAATAWVALGPRTTPATEELATDASAVQSAAVSRQAATPCPARAIAASAGDKDGQFEPEPDLTRNKASDITAFIIIGKEAAAAGRQRDAEVAFIMSCRVADRFRGPASLDAAEARYQLGRHYANLVLNAGTVPPGSRAELLKRADLLYADSLDVFRAKHGDAHEKSRFAAEGLARVQQNLARVEQAPGAKQTTQVATVSPPPAAPGARAPNAAPAVQKALPPEPAEARRAPTQEMGASARPRPSFDCARAQSASERAICADPELSQLDRELGRLHFRAKSAAQDKAAFNRHNDAEWRKRESSCRGDRECLRDWYQYRRNQLLNNLDESNG